MEFSRSDSVVMGVSSLTAHNQGEKSACPSRPDASEQPPSYLQPRDGPAFRATVAYSASSAQHFKAMLQTLPERILHNHSGAPSPIASNRRGALALLSAPPRPKLRKLATTVHHGLFAYTLLSALLLPLTAAYPAHPVRAALREPTLHRSAPPHSRQNSPVSATRLHSTKTALLHAHGNPAPSPRLHAPK